MPYDFSIVPKYISFFPRAALMTLEITALGILLGMVIGLITAFARISNKFFFRYPAKLYIFLVRGTPLLLQLFIIYYGLATIVRIPSFPSAVIALGIHNGAYIGEVFRGAIQSIDEGQMEAARSIGMSYSLAMKRIILPQAFQRAIPPLGNQFIIALKDSSLASTIAVGELLLKARQLGSSTFRYMEMLLIAALFYLILTSVFTLIVGYIEKSLQVERRGEDVTEEVLLNDPNTEPA
ncbi:amino acid ABC transporter permease [Halocella sp. SP3-1]|uniref:amino acid ABC transporter permease n=1 Tax=Halocella sp. SP3-1 TaxID=2382161 RepID=UPI000F76252D|nr:amino acid ABC transporter permease [Halocella sp. SP3-1]